ncbi:MAG: hypothetical protein ABI036_21095 [Fibrobacteria bacterium]
MTKAKRRLLWGLMAAPFLIAPSAFILTRAWLNHHLQRELSFGDFRIRLANPNLAWNLNFFSDSLEISAPRFSLRTGRLLSEVRVLKTLFTFKPDLRMTMDTVRIRLEPDTSETARERARKKRRIPAFPNLRLPIGFRISAVSLQVRIGDRESFEAQNLSLYSQGPKGAAVSASGIVFRTGTDSLPRSYQAMHRFSLRWFGKSVRYQARVQNSTGDFVRLEGEHRKSDLREGRDSLEASFSGLDGLASLFPGKHLPGISQVDVQAGWHAGEHKAGMVKTAFTTPKVWQIGPQRVELRGNLEDSSGKIVLMSRGLRQEILYLQGRFEIPGVDSLARIPKEMTASLSGYSHDFRFRLANRILPGDAEIRRLKLLPGLNFEAEVRTRDSSVLHGRAFRVPDSSARVASGIRASSSHPSRPARPDSTWRLQFSGTVDPRESWVHAWVDTNVAFRRARLKGDLGRAGLVVEAWIDQPRAYGAAGDSLYAIQTITRKGYYLTASRLHYGDVIWPVTGQVEWGKRPPGRPGRKLPTSLVFRTKHPRYGAVAYSMARPGSMAVRASEVDCLYLPYTRLRGLVALKPVVSGAFEWDWKARTGRIGAAAELDYAGQALSVKTEADWTALSFHAKAADVSYRGSTLNLSGDLRLGGKQFWEMKRAGLKDIQGLALRADKFDAASLGVFLGPRYPVERGSLNGKLTYTDTSGFQGQYQVRDLELAPLRRLLAIPRVDLMGQGESLRLTLRTASAAYPALSDSIDIRIADILGSEHSITIKAHSDDGIRFGFEGVGGQNRGLQGAFTLDGDVALPGDAGVIKNARLGGRVQAPFAKNILMSMVLDSAAFSGRYAVPGLDTQSLGGTLSMRDGRLRIPDLRATQPGGGVTLRGEADCDFTGPPKVMAKVRAGTVAVKWPGIQKLILTDADASLSLDSAGMRADAKIGKAVFASSKPPISMRGNLENVDLDYFRPRAPKVAKGMPSVPVPDPELKIKAKLRDFLFKHKIGFRQLQKSIRTVKTDKRKKRVKPVDLQINLETAGSENRVETDVLRMFFVGDLSVKGVYPYTLLTGEFSSLSGELGQTSQSYDITDFDLKWQNATVEEGRISVEGGKRLRSDCKPDTKRTCNVYVKLAGRLDEMAFTYDSDCGGNSGENLEPSALINSVSRGCYSSEYVAGAGGGNYGEAVFVLLEPTINEKLSSVGDKFSGGWIKHTSVTGIATAVSGDTAGSEPVAIGVESKEKWGISFKAKAGYHPEKKLQNPWESKAAMEWRPPLELASKNSEWKRRVRDRVTLEASAETRPEEKASEENRQVRKQVGIRYRYKFWDLW